MINKPGTVKIRDLKELRAGAKTGQGVTKSAESSRRDSFWRLEEAMGSAHIWNAVRRARVRGK